LLFLIEKTKKARNFAFIVENILGIKERKVIRKTVIISYQITARLIGKENQRYSRRSTKQSNYRNQK
jgi:hypothetical protein